MNSDELIFELDNAVLPGGTMDHSLLENLDYENSGHTGFQPAGDYVEDDNYVHTDNNFTNEYKNKIETNETNIETLSGELEEQGQDIQTLQNKVDVIEQDIDDLGAEVDNLDTNKQDKLTAGQNITIVDNVISATGGTGGIVIDVGSNQYVYEGYSLPAINKNDLATIYNNHKASTPQTIKWTLLGSETYLSCVSADYIVSNYSIDVLVHNKYHCSYTWNDSTTGLVNPEVMTGEVADWEDITNKPFEDIGEGVSSNVSNELVSNFITGNYGKPKVLTSVDLNTINNTGVYSCDMCTNRPNNSNGVMLVIKNGGTSDNLVQVYWTFQNDTMWVRHKDLGNWKTWIKTNNLTASDIIATNTQSVQVNLERIDDELANRQITYLIDEFPDSLDDNALYRAETEIIHSGKTYGVGLYQVINNDLELIIDKKYVDDIVGDIQTLLEEI